MLFALKEKGQGLVEYALIMVLVAIVVIAALEILGPLFGESGYRVWRFFVQYGWYVCGGFVVCSLQFSPPFMFGLMC